MYTTFRLVFIKFIQIILVNDYYFKPLLRILFSTFNRFCFQFDFMRHLFLVCSLFGRNNICCSAAKARLIITQINVFNEWCNRKIYNTVKLGNEPFLLHTFTQVQHRSVHVFIITLTALTVPGTHRPLQKQTKH